MKRGIALSAMCALLAGALAAPAQAAPPENFRAHLTGAGEVPAVDTAAQGQSIVRIVDGGAALEFQLIVANIDGVVQSHIHCGAEGVNGPVVVFLFGPVPAGVTHNGLLAAGTATAADLIPLPDSPECPGGIADFDDLLAKIRSGDAYVNVHSLEFPAGEIRGQL
jgi:hypothetical protein